MLDSHDAKLAADYEASLSRLLYSNSIQHRDVDTLVATPTFSSKFWKHHLAFYLRKRDMYPDAEELDESQAQTIRKVLTMLRQQYKLEVHLTSELSTLMAAGSR